MRIIYMYMRRVHHPTTASILSKGDSPPVPLFTKINSHTKSQKQ